MSADSWTICPKCKSINPDEKPSSVLVEEVSALYGTIPHEEYDFLMYYAKKAREYPAPSVREDYEMILSEWAEEGYGNFTMRYSASCQLCDFKFSYSHEENIDLGLGENCSG